MPAGEREQCELPAGVDVLRDGGEFYYFGRVERCLLYTSDAADERSSVDLGGRRIIKKKNKKHTEVGA